MDHDSCSIKTTAVAVAVGGLGIFGERRVAEKSGCEGVLGVLLKQACERVCWVCWV